MKIYVTLISWAGSLDHDVDGWYWDKEAAIRDAKEIIADDERGRNNEDEYDIDYVTIGTMIPDENGKFTGICTEKVEHKTKKENEQTTKKNRKC